MHSSGFFQIKPIARLILKCEISGSHTISDQSLLLSTIILNDTYLQYYFYSCLPLSIIPYASEVSENHHSDNFDSYKINVIRTLQSSTSSYSIGPIGENVVGCL